MTSPPISAPEKFTWLKFVRHEFAEEHLAMGWKLADNLRGTNHGFYSVLMVWGGEGEPA